MEEHYIPFEISKVDIDVYDKLGKKYGFTHEAVESQWDVMGQVKLNPKIEKLIHLSQNLDELCEILRTCTINIVEPKNNAPLAEIINKFKDNKEEFPGYNIWEKHLNETEKTKNLAIEEIKENLNSLTDIKNITITAYAGIDIEEDLVDTDSTIVKKNDTEKETQYVINIEI